MASMPNKAKAAQAPAFGPGEFYDAVFASPDIAAYVIRVGNGGEFVFEDANEMVAQTSGKALPAIRGRTPHEVLQPELADCLAENLRRCVETRLAVAYHRTIDFPDGGRVSFKTRLTPIVRERGTVEFVVGMTRDVTHETVLIENAQHHAALLRALGIALPSAVYILDLETQTLRFIGGEASATQLEWRKGVEGIGPERAAQFFHPDDALRLKPHWAELAALADGQVSTVSYRLLAHNGEYRRHVNREIVFSRDAKGAVKLVLGVSEDVTEQDRMEQEVRDLSARMLTVQIDERRRIAEELHDSTGQYMAAAVLALCNARKIRRSGGDDAIYDALIGVIDEAAECLAGAQREIRGLSFLLHPPHLVSGGLAEALETFARGFGKRTGLRIAVDVSSAASTIDDETAVQLFRICQEGLANVFRHAKARKVLVALEVDETAIRLTVKDDGIGFDDSALEGLLGVGLSGIRERVTRLGGTFDLAGDPGGTTLAASLPREWLRDPGRRGQADRRKPADIMTDRRAPAANGKP
jgi:PAS domain S-box-containing protein